MPVSFLSRDSKNFLLEPHSIGHMWLMPGDSKGFSNFELNLCQLSIRAQLNPYSAGLLNVA